ncbi:hypothetical protein ES319_A12G121500v1 [Gossypium barbadense]|uniref:Protein TILLER ANGLE CONTROL 1 n=3 Tax=Gossypium TaxID=3633 RepID=A0A2P5WXE5_GOSBA|nr:hypothetical protein ES319_A12G121500v1 [Gossypium barbadense]PPR95760.1 hypothetical protein GOBAR_AA24915 [Gossypium barbadense]TYG89825.1 hypothetical protein ES288_A12G131900v1 [Gossypium darwinii]TYH95811.1 hypothetical protein ES332_A12G133000v1 [Gossypium tomentosum]
MKIFNWVHRRFNHTILKDGLAPNVKNTDEAIVIEQVALVDVLDGILTIGTLGFDPLESGGQKDYENDDEHGEEQRCSDDSVGDNDDGDVHFDDGNEEVNRLMFGALDHGFKDEAMPVCEIKGQSGNRRRTTLAELFSADSPSGLEMELNCGKKAIVGTKQGNSLAMKLVPQVGEGSGPIKMLQKTMRRMLKRKIHPEVEGKRGQCCKKHEACEFVSLLQSQGAAATA